MKRPNYKLAGCLALLACVAMPDPMKASYGLHRAKASKTAPKPKFRATVKLRPMR